MPGTICGSRSFSSLYRISSDHWRRRVVTEGLKFGFDMENPFCNGLKTR